MTVMIGRNSGIMMQAFVSKLMVTLVLAQAVSGWCCHRPCHCLEGEAAEVSSETSACDCCHDDNHDVLALHATSHCQCHECLGFCTFVAGAKSQVVRPEAASGFDLAATTPRPATTRLGMEQGAASGESNHLAPPVRLHLLHQSLLI
jgi:hypothetical protein